MRRRRVRDNQEPPLSGVHSTSISSRSSVAPLLVGWMTRRLLRRMSSLLPRVQGQLHPLPASSSLQQFVDAAVSPATRYSLSLRTQVAHLAKDPRLPVIVLAHKDLASRLPRVLRALVANTRSATYPRSQKSKRHWGMPARPPRASPRAKCGDGLRTTWMR